MLLEFFSNKKLYYLTFHFLNVTRIGMQNNTHYIHLLMELIPSSEKFKTFYSEKFPSIKESIIAYSLDTKCDCKNEIIDFHNKNKEESDKAIKSFISSYPEEINLVEFLKRMESNYIGGKVIKIDKSDSAFYELVNNINQNGYYFRTVNVIPEEKSLTFLFF